MADTVLAHMTSSRSSWLKWGGNSRCKCRSRKTDANLYSLLADECPLRALSRLGVNGCSSSEMSASEASAHIIIRVIGDSRCKSAWLEQWQSNKFLATLRLQAAPASARAMLTSQLTMSRWCMYVGIYLRWNVWYIYIYIYIYRYIEYWW